MKACVRQWLAEQMPGVEGDMLESIYSEYAATARKLVAELSAVDRTAHTLKGNAMMVGDQPMADAAIAFRARLAEMQALLGEL